MNATGPREQANNERLRRAVSDLTLDKPILTEAARRNHEKRQWTEDLSKMDKKLSQMDNSHVT